MSILSKVAVILLIIIAGILCGSVFSYVRIKQLEARLFPPTDPTTGEYITF